MAVISKKGNKPQKVSRSGDDLEIKVKPQSRLMLLIASIVLMAASLIIEHFIGLGWHWPTIILACIVGSLFCMILAINSSFERLTLEKDLIKYRYFLLVERKGDRNLIDRVEIGERSKSMKWIVNGKKFANLNFSIIDIDEEEFADFAKRQNIPIEYLENK